MDVILVVDDDEGVRGVIDRALAQSGFSVVTASTGPEGWAHIQQKAFSMVITDWMMPNGTGGWLIEQIMASAIHIPVIILTSIDKASCLRPEWKERNIHYLQKPFVLSEMIALVRQQLN